MPKGNEATAPRRPRHASRRLTLLLVGGLSTLLLIALGVYKRAGDPDAGAARAAAPLGARADLTPAAQDLLASSRDRAAVVSGRVSSEPMTALPGVSVCVTPAPLEPMPRHDRRCVEVPPSGDYSMRVEPGRYTLSAAARGFAFAGLAEGLPFVLAEAEHKSADFVLQPGVRLAGEVLDATGGPVPGAQLRVVRMVQRHASPLFDLTADREGRFEVWTRAGSSHLLRVDAPGYAGVLVRLPAPQLETQIVLAPGGAIRGRVVAQGSGQPLSGVDVRALLIGADPPSFGAGRSDAHGAFAIEGLMPGTHSLSAEAEHARGELAEPVLLELGGVVSGVELALEPASSLTGKVLIEPSRAPCQQGVVRLGAELGFDPARKELPALTESSGRILPELFAATNAAGEVHFRAVPPGVYRVAVRCTNHLFASGPAELRVERAPLTGQLWTVRPGLRLKLRVVDERGEPARRAAFFLRWPEGGMGLVRFVADDRGEFSTASDLVRGTYTVLPGVGYRAEPVAVAVQAPGQPAEATLRLRGRHAITVLVQSEQGSPLDAVKVTAKRSADEQSEPAEADAPTVIAAVPIGAGRHRIAPLLAGRYRVEVLDGVNPPVAARADDGELIVLGSDHEEQLARAVLPGSASLRGQVVEGAGEPLANVWIAAVYRAAGEPHSWGAAAATTRRVLSDLEGTFELSGLRADTRYDVRAEFADGHELFAYDVAVQRPLRLVREP